MVEVAGIKDQSEKTL
jgi:hypothetical protein